MSNALAIAAVSAVLKDLLENGLIDALASTAIGNPVAVSVRQPDRVLGQEAEKAQLNLFLYHVAPNQGWRNVGLPARDQAGTAVNNPPLALDLTYLVTAYGDNNLEAEILLGYAMQLLHETPTLARKTIEHCLKKTNVLNGKTLPSGDGVLSAAALAEQVEQIKLTLQPVNTDEMAKLWSAFQAKYRPSVVYLASVVLIEQARPVKQAPPVREQRFFALPFARPVIETVAPQMVTVGEPITLTGQNLAGSDVTVNFDGHLVGETSVTPDKQLRVSVPVSLAAGIHTVQVVHTFALNSGRLPVEPPRRFESNLAAFVLRPTITGIEQVPGAKQIQINFAPPVAREQTVVLLLDEQLAGGEAARAARSYRLDAPENNGIKDAVATTKMIVFDVTAVEPASLPYFVRLRVDGTESRLNLVPDSPSFGPVVTIA